MPTMTSESGLLISPEVSPPTDDGADAQSLTPSPSNVDERNRTIWQDLIDNTLIEWGRDPRQLGDEDVDPPTKEIIRLATTLAQTWRDQNLAPPNNVVSDPNGGIVFERRQGDVTEVFHLWDNGLLEYQQFLGTELTLRNAIDDP